MGMTLTEKILAAHCGEREVRPAQFISARVDMALANDITAPLAIKAFDEMGATEVFDVERVALVLDHYVPAKDVASAAQSKLVRDFARRQGIAHFYDVGRGGIEHALLPEQGLVVAGDVVIGADSHTCTYGALGAFATGVGSTDVAAVMALGECWLMVPSSLRITVRGKPGAWVSGKDVILYLIGQMGVAGARYQAMEYAGDGLAHLGMADRLTIANMAIEAGAKNGILPVDEVTREYLKGRARHEWVEYQPDADANYVGSYEVDLAALEPQVATPHLPENSIPVSQVGDVAIDQVFIGACTNGTIDDLRAAARVLKGKTVHPRVRLLVIPATQAVFEQGMEEGIAGIVVAAGGVYSTPTCGPCLGGHMGILAAGERCLATSNRNFRGRMGDPASEVYLSGPAVAAASAVAGKIAHPDEVA